MSIARVNSAKVQWKNIIQLRLPLSLTNSNNHHPKSPLTLFPGNRKSQLSQTALEEYHPVAIATFLHQLKQPPPQKPINPFLGNRKSQLSQSAMEEHHTVAIATFPNQPKQPPPQKPTNPFPWQSQESTQPKCIGRASSSCDCHFPSPTQTTTTPKAH